MNKSVILVVCTLFSLAVLVSSCQKTLDQPGFPGFRCAFGNAEYIADSAYYKTRQAGVLGTVIYAYSAGIKRFQFNLLHNTSNVVGDSIGSFTLDSTANVAYYFAPDGTIYRSTGGTLNITQYYNDSLGVINGNFSFDSREPGSSGKSLNFTYGYFNSIPKR